MHSLLLAKPILPVVVVETAEQGLWVAQGLLEAGMDQIEITLRTPGALAAIQAIAKTYPSMRLFAGTIRSSEDFRRAHEAGAQHFISPGFTPSLDAAAKQQGLSWIPGVATASEVMQASEAGYQVLKFFPAMQAGGPAAIASIASALQGIQFIPTGGVRVDALAQWKALACVAGVGGTWLTSGLAFDVAGQRALSERVRAALNAWELA